MHFLSAHLLSFIFCDFHQPNSDPVFTAETVVRVVLLYCHDHDKLYKQMLYTQHIINMHIYIHICRIHIDSIIQTSDTVLRKIYLSLYCKVCVWEGDGDRIELQYIGPHSYGHQRCVFLVLLMLNRTPGGSAFCWLSLLHLVTNSPELQLLDFLSSLSYIIVQSPT